MLSNLTSQLKEQNAEDRYYEVLEEVPRVRKDLGEPPLVTPSSQIVGTQAVMNVLMGERYKVATKETKDILSGKYGETVKPFNEEVKKKVLGDDAEVITCRPADLIPDEMDTLRKECEQYATAGRRRIVLRTVPAGGHRLLQVSAGTADKSRRNHRRYRKRKLSGVRKRFYCWGRGISGNPPSPFAA